VHRFAIANRGGSELVIDDIRRSCSCTGLEREVDGKFTVVESLRLQPNETVNVNIRVAIRGRIGEPMRNQITMRTNDPNRPQAAIHVTADVSAGFTTSPTTVLLGTLVVGKETHTNITVRDAAAVRRKVVRVDSSAPEQFSVRFHPSDENTNSEMTESGPVRVLGYVEATVYAHSPGPIEGEVRIYLDDPSREPTRIPVWGRATQPVEAVPASLVLPRSSQDGPIYFGECIMRSNDNSPFSLDAESLPPGVTVKFEPNQGQSTQQIVRIELNPEYRELPAAEPVQHVRLRATAGAQSTIVDIPVQLQLPGKQAKVR
jgi:hypothetical protein